MSFIQLIISFIVLMVIIVSVISFILKRTLISNTESAVNRLNQEISRANAKQAELSKKLKEADMALQKRQQEAKELEEKMRTTTEEEMKAEREKIISKARTEGEEIITKAQNATEKMKQEIEKDNDVKVVDQAMDILNQVLSEKAKKALNTILVDEFIYKLKEIDMSKISPDVTTADVIVLNDLEEKSKQQIAEIITSKLQREISINIAKDEKLGGGVLLKFGSMALDGSIQNLIREVGTAKKISIDAQYS
ncbi:MAG: F0F1 ATP synthase subunit delta [Candidatus Omnitrophica bacterium]|nr:F0F1 ATP synthase subunit delta [Candidatus Omnitrophota bacterium]